MCSRSPIISDPWEALRRRSLPSCGFWPTVAGTSTSSTRASATTGRAGRRSSACQPRSRVRFPRRGAPVSSTLGVIRSIGVGVRRRPSVLYVHNAGDVPVALGDRSGGRRTGRGPSPPATPHQSTCMAQWLPPAGPGGDRAFRRHLRSVVAAGRPPRGPRLDDSDRRRRRAVSPLLDSERVSIRDAIGVGPADDMILYVGRLQRIKGVHVLLESARRLPTAAKVVVCGDATDPGYRDELVHAGGNAVFLGRRSDVPELMAAADLLVVPSDCMETQGLVVHESMACGTPVVASDVGGLRASMAGFPDQLVKPGDAVAVSGVVERFVHWRHHDPELGARSRRWVTEHMSIEVTTDSVDAVLSSAVESGCHQRRGGRGGRRQPAGRRHSAGRRLENRVHEISQGTSLGAADGERSRSCKELT